MGGPDAAASHTSQPEGVVQPDPREQSVVADYTESVVPPSARRSNFRMFLTFGSMQLVFGAVLVGYSARFEGLSLGKLIAAMAIATITMTVYSIGSANVGAVAGQTHAVTTRSIFGTIGSAIVSLLLVIDGMGFYLFTVLFVITLGQALLGTIAAVSLVTALLAFVMIFNNYFGFTGLGRVRDDQGVHIGVRSRPVGGAARGRTCVHLLRHRRNGRPVDLGQRTGHLPLRQGGQGVVVERADDRHPLRARRVHLPDHGLPDRHAVAAA